MLGSCFRVGWIGILVLTAGAFFYVSFYGGGAGWGVAYISVGAALDV